MAKPAPLHDVELALEQLFRLGANRRFDARQTAALDTTVTRAGYAVLRCLAASEAATIRALAQACVMDTATASRQVDRLVGDGLVARQQSSEDARAVELTITGKGQRVYDDVVAYRLDYLSEVLHDWNRADLAAMAAAIARLTEDLRSYSSTD